MQDALLRLRYRYWPDHLLGEILSKRWTETAIPVIVLLIITVLLSNAIPGFLSPGGLADTGRQAGEIGFVVLAGLPSGIRKAAGRQETPGSRCSTAR